MQLLRRRGIILLVVPSLVLSTLPGARGDSSNWPPNRDSTSVFEEQALTPAQTQFTPAFSVSRGVFVMNMESELALEGFGPAAPVAEVERPIDIASRLRKHFRHLGKRLRIVEAPGLPLVMTEPQWLMEVQTPLMELSDDLTNPIDVQFGYTSRRVIQTIHHLGLPPSPYDFVPIRSRLEELGGTLEWAWLTPQDVELIEQTVAAHIKPDDGADHQVAMKFYRTIARVFEDLIQSVELFRAGLENSRASDDELKAVSDSIKGIDDQGLTPELNARGILNHVFNNVANRAKSAMTFKFMSFPAEKYIPMLDRAQGELEIWPNYYRYKRHDVPIKPGYLLIVTLPVANPSNPIATLAANVYQTYKTIRDRIRNRNTHRLAKSA